jgi:hypothetical protein
VTDFRDKGKTAPKAESSDTTSSTPKTETAATPAPAPAEAKPASSGGDAS